MSSQWKTTIKIALIILIIAYFEIDWFVYRLYNNTEYNWTGMNLNLPGGKHVMYIGN